MSKKEKLKPIPSNSREIVIPELTEIKEFLKDLEKRNSYVDEILNVFLPEFFGEVYNTRLKEHLTHNFELTGTVQITRYKERQYD